MKIYPEVIEQINIISAKELVSEDRKAVLSALIDYLQSKRGATKSVILEFICTHNSRRSQLAQVWAEIAAKYYNFENLSCYSGGTEQTAVYPTVLAAIKSQGCQVISLSDGQNPIYGVKYSESQLPILLFSKIVTHEYNPTKGFAALMTCSEAAENCPVVFGMERRLSLPYIDPKATDGSEKEQEAYLATAEQIAAEMLYVFSKLK